MSNTNNKTITEAIEKLKRRKTPFGGGYDVWNEGVNDAVEAIEDVIGCGIDDAFSEPKVYKYTSGEKWVSEKEWNGEGLPPVGVECEYYSSTHTKMQPEDCNFNEHCIINTWSNGDRLSVLGCATKHGIKYPVVQNIETEDVSTIALKYIRPIRTEREKAIDEMYFDVTGETASHDEIMDWDGWNTCRAAYDAGYRKTERK